jgi:toxin ParE1/3/4
LTKVEWTRRACTRLGEIHDYIARDSPDRAIALFERLIEATERLARHPLIGAIVPEDGAYRQLVVEGYRVLYRHTPTRVYIMTIVGPGMLTDNAL